MSQVLRAAGPVAACAPLVACGFSADEPVGTGEAAATTEAEPKATPASPPAAHPAFVQLCDVLASAGVGDPERVRTTFDHDPRLRLRSSRPIKPSSRASPNPPMPAEAIAVDLDALADATGEAYAVTGPPQPSCEEPA